MPDLAIRPGLALPERRMTADAVQLFHFSAACNMGHRIHYDCRWTRDVEGFPGLIVPTTLMEAVMHGMLSDWAGPGAWVRGISLRNRGSAYCDEEIIYRATVSAIRDEGAMQLVDIAFLIEKADGALVAPGSATVAGLYPLIQHSF